MPAILAAQPQGAAEELRSALNPEARVLFVAIDHRIQEDTDVFSDNRTPMPNAHPPPKPPVDGSAEERSDGGIPVADSGDRWLPAQDGTVTYLQSPAAPSTKPISEPSTPKEPASGKHKSDRGSDKGERPSKSKEPGNSKPAKEPEIAPPPKVDPPPPKEKKPKAKDDLDSLLDTASSGSGGKPKAAEKKDLPEQLSRDQISSGFKSANTSACKGEGASGIYNVKLTIGRNGRVSDANVVSGGEGKDCVAKAVKGAKFPEFSGDPMSLTYPFIVR